jgi:hypothetical protein
MTRAHLLTLVLVLLAPSLAAAAPPGSCEIKATGGLTFESKGAGNAGSFGSDYWLTDDELKMGLRAIAGIGKKMTDEEKAKKVDEQMKADPRFMLFLLNCQTEAATVNFGPSRGSKYKDVPMAARSYTIAGKGSPAKPGEMQVMVNIKDGKGFWRAQAGGKLEVTAFDKKHIAGTFEIPLREGLGKEGGTEAKLTGRFDFPCATSKSCEK